MKSLKQLIVVYGDIMIYSLSIWQIKELRKSGSKLRICSNCGAKIVISNLAKYYSRCPQCFKTVKIYNYHRGIDI